MRLAAIIKVAGATALSKATQHNQFGFENGMQIAMKDDKASAKEALSEAELCANYLKALGDSNRLQIMRALRTSPLTVTDMSLLLDSQMANVSHHLRVLFHAGLVTTKREGKFIYYQINREVVRSKAVSNALDLGCCRLEMRT